MKHHYEKREERRQKNKRLTSEAGLKKSAHQTSVIMSGILPTLLCKRGRDGCLFSVSSFQGDNNPLMSLQLVLLGPTIYSQSIKIIKAAGPVLSSHTPASTQTQPDESLRRARSSPVPALTSLCPTSDQDGDTHVISHIGPGHHHRMSAGSSISLCKLSKDVRGARPRWQRSAFLPTRTFPQTQTRPPGGVTVRWSPGLTEK